MLSLKRSVFIAMDEIQEIIKKNAEKKEPTLDLRNMRLSDFPEEIFQLQHIKTLLLGNKEVVGKMFFSLGEAFWRTCEKQHNEVLFLPETIGQLKNLEVLDLNQVELYRLPESIGELTALKELHLANNQLYELPKSFAQLQNLEVLDISFNCFGEFPMEVLACKKLKNLNIGSNRLSHIPDEISQLQELVSLNFQNFNPKAAKPFFIEKYDLYCNHITELPNSLQCLKKLRYVKCKGNPIEPALKRFLENLWSFEDIDLWFNHKKKWRDFFRDEVDEDF